MGRTINSIDSSSLFEIEVSMSSSLLKEIKNWLSFFLGSSQKSLWTQLTKRILPRGTTRLKPQPLQICKPLEREISVNKRIKYMEYLHPSFTFTAKAKKALKGKISSLANCCSSSKTPTLEYNHADYRKGIFSSKERQEEVISYSNNNNNNYSALSLKSWTNTA